MHGETQSQTEGAILPRIALAALLSCGIFPTIGLFSPGLVLPQIEREFSQTPNAALLTELVGTLASFAFAIGAPVAGALIARLGCRAVFLPALALFALAGSVPALLNDLWAILAARVMLGLALAAIFTGALTGIGALRDELRMSMFGWFSVVGGATAILMFPLIGALGHISWRFAFLVNLLALPAMLLVLALPKWLGVASPQHGAGAAHARGGGLLNPAMAFLLALAALAGMGMLIGPIYAPLHLTSLGISDPRMLAVPVTIGSITAVLAAAIYGKAHHALGSYGLWALTLLAMGAALVVGGLTASIPLFTVAVVINSAMVAMMAPNVSATAMIVSAPHLKAQAIGLANGVMFGAQLAFPFIAAWVRGAVGLAGVFIFFGMAVLLAGAATAGWALIGRRRRVVA